LFIIFIVIGLLVQGALFLFSNRKNLFLIPIRFWTSAQLSDKQTAQYIPHEWKKTHLRLLNDLDCGDCDGMTYDDVASLLPNEYAARAAEKFTYRFPRGESYEDLIVRLEPLALELERQTHPVIVIASKAVIRVLYGYLLDKDPQECPFLHIPPNSIIQIVPKAYGNEEKIFTI